MKKNFDSWLEGLNLTSKARQILADQEVTATVIESWALKLKKGKLTEANLTTELQDKCKLPYGPASLLAAAVSALIPGLIVISYSHLRLQKRKNRTNLL